jgi:hypothetical protein
VSLLVTWMVRGLACSRTGMVRVRTPAASVCPQAWPGELPARGVVVLAMGRQQIPRGAEA